MASNRDEVLRFEAQISGKKDAQEMGKAFDTVGAAAEAADPKARELIDELERATKLRASISALGGLTAQLQETGDTLFLAKRRAAELQAEFDATLEPSKKLTRELQQAQAAVTRLTAEEGRLTAAVQASQNAVKAAGFDLTRLGQAQAAATQRAAQASQRVREYSKSLTQTSTTAERSISIFTRLRGVIASMLAALSLNTLANAVIGILKLGDAAERTRNQFAQLYSSTSVGNAVLAQLAKFASDNGLALDATTQAAAALKRFGIDPLNGSLQAMVDQNAAAGGSVDDLNGKLLALGQAWSKEKLQAEEALQLIERGVPVWQLLSQALGKTVPELQKLSEAGKLGRKEIALLIAEIGKMNAGAAAKNAGTLSGQFQQLTGRIREFFTQVANSGTLDYFKDQLAALNQRIRDMAASGQLAALAKSISDGIVGTAQAIAGVVGFVRDYGEQLLLLARAYVVLKAAGAISSFAKASMSAFEGIAKSTAGATGAMGKFRALSAGIGAGVQFALLAAAVDFAVGRIEKLVSVTQEYFEVQEKLKQQQAELKTQSSELAAQARVAAQLYRDAGKVQLEAIDAIQRKSRAQLQEYIKQLENAYRLNISLRDAARQKGDAEGLNNLIAAGRDLVITLEAAKAALGAAGGGIGAATGEFARKSVADFDTAVKAGKNAALALSGIFDKLDLTTPQGVKDLVETLNAVGPRARDARAALEGELLVALEKLNGEQLRAFQKQATQAMLAAQTGARDAALVLDTVLAAALTRLGLSATQAGVAFTQTGRDIIATFQAVVENARATSDQIAQAFEAALAQVTTKEEAEALGQAIKRAGETGRIGLDQAKDAAAALTLRIREITNAADPLADEFERLGIKSKAQLDATRDAAERAFNAIVRGAQRGKAAQDDVRAAFIAYVETARAAAAHSDSAGKAQVEAQLRAKAAALGLTQALKEVSAAGADAGAAVAAGADQAAEALGRTSDAASDAADSAGDLGANSNAAANGLQNVANAGQQATEIALDLNAAFASAASTMEGLDRIAFNVAAEQQRQAQEMLDSLRQQNLQYDEQAQRMENLRREFGYLGDATLQQIAREQELLEQNQKRRQDQQRQQQESASGSSGSGSAGGVIRVQVEVKGGGGIRMEDLKNRQLAEDLVRAIQPAMSTLARRGLQFPGG